MVSHFRFSLNISGKAIFMENQMFSTKKHTDVIFAHKLDMFLIFFVIIFIQFSIYSTVNKHLVFFYHKLEKFFVKIIFDS